MAILLILLFVAVLADILVPYPLGKPLLILKAYTLPFIDPAHPLQLDGSNRGYPSRLLLYGARSSLIVGLAVSLIAFTIGQIPADLLPAFGANPSERLVCGINLYLN